MHRWQPREHVMRLGLPTMDDLRIEIGHRAQRLDGERRTETGPDLVHELVECQRIARHEHVTWHRRVVQRDFDRVRRRIPIGRELHRLVAAPQRYASRVPKFTAPMNDQTRRSMSAPLRMWTTSTLLRSWSARRANARRQSELIFS